MSTIKEHITSLELAPEEVYAASILISLGASVIADDAFKAQACLDEVDLLLKDGENFGSILNSTIRKINLMYLTLRDQVQQEMREEGTFQ